ncbi:MAG: hypothetical protein HQK84_10555 [Nitrospinae bacterium]|nr:hypothetical protein [Nitrospinota bacterium]
MNVLLVFLIIINLSSCSNSCPVEIGDGETFIGSTADELMKVKGNPKRIIDFEKSKGHLYDLKFFKTLSYTSRGNSKNYYDYDGTQYLINKDMEVIGYVNVKSNVPQKMKFVSELYPWTESFEWKQVHKLPFKSSVS